MPSSASARLGASNGTRKRQQAATAAPWPSTRAAQQWEYPFAESIRFINARNLPAQRYESRGFGVFRVHRPSPARSGLFRNAIDPGRAPDEQVVAGKGGRGQAHIILGQFVCAQQLKLVAGPNNEGHAVFVQADRKSTRLNSSHANISY